MRIRDASADDADSVARIYNPFVLETHVSFELEPVSAAEMAQRIERVQRAGLPWLVGEIEAQIAGYCYATPWKAREAYRRTVESAIYMAPSSIGRGLGTRLYQALFERLVEAGLHTVLGGIALPNPASVALHERLGMQPVARLGQVGFKCGRWIDVGYWQKHLAP